MCGIVAVLQPALDADAWRSTLGPMTEALAYRGPDDAGTWVDPSAGIGLGHRRLSILDLSARGHQPMASRDGRFQVVYNGELYNFRALHRTLEDLGHPITSESDTEVMLAAFVAWGIEGALARMNGMFALAVWDAEERRLVLARDRLGEKPLYYGRIGRGERSAFVAASQLGALTRHPAWDRSVDRDNLALYLRHSCVPGHYSIYRGISKVLPGCVVTVSADGVVRDEPGGRPYWSLPEVAARGRAEPVSLSDDEAIEALDRRLRDAVSMRMVSDVPLGAFLSGGIDSSLVVAQMQAASVDPVRTFTIGFEVDGFDEAPWARRVAEHLGTDHTELVVTADDALAVVPRLGAIYDEPFADSSQIPTFLVSELARRHVTVCLSGDGGDELFGGYKRYRLTEDLWRRLARVPRPLRRLAAPVVGAVPAGLANRLLASRGGLFEQYGRRGPAGDKLKKLARVLGVSSPAQLYRHLISHWRRPEAVVLGAHEPPTALSQPGSLATLPALVERMMALDQVGYLPDDILVKLDRASMAVSLESRVPLLDHELVEWVWRLPVHFKVRGGTSKWLLREVLARHVPRPLFERTKMGFGVPMAEWLRGPLRDWAEALIAPDRLRREGYFEPAPIRALWDEHLAGHRQWHDRLWDVLMFQAWRETWA